MPSIQIAKAKIQEVSQEDKVVTELISDLAERLQLCDNTMSERCKEIITTRVRKNADSICKNIDDRFPQQSMTILEAFSIFDVSQRYQVM